MLEERAEIVVAEFGIEIEAELGELEGNFGAETRSANAIDEAEIVLGDQFGFGAQRDVFAEMGKDGAEPLGAEATGGGESILHIFAGHEAGDGAAHETEPRRVLPHPRALRRHQDRATH